MHTKNKRRFRKKQPLVFLDITTYYLQLTTSLMRSQFLNHFIGNRI